MIVRRRLRVFLSGVSLSLLPVSPAYSQQANPRGLLLVLQDSLGVLQSSVAEFNRELQGAGADTVLVRATTVMRHCQGTSVVLPATIETMGEASRSGRGRREATSVVGALRSLDLALRDCEGGFSDSGPGERADTLRIWGVFRSKQVEQAIRGYRLAAGRYADAAGFRLEEKPAQD